MLARTDVLVWWGHAAHGEVDDAVVERVYQHVLSGMGLPGSGLLRGDLVELNR